MTQASSLPRKQGTSKAQNKDNNFIHGLILGMALVIFVVWSGTQFFSDTESYQMNVFTEAISVSSQSEFTPIVVTESGCLNHYNTS